MAQRENEASEKRLWKGLWPFGLAALLATSLLYVPCFAFVATMGQAAHFAVALSFIGCTAMVVAGVAAVAIHGRKQRLGGPRTRITGSVVYVAGSLCFVAAAVSGSPSMALVTAAGVLQGIGGFSLYLGWGLAYRQLGLRSSFFYIAASLGLAILADFAITQLAAPANFVLFAALCFVASIVPLLRTAEPDATPKLDEDDPAPSLKFDDVRKIGRAIHAPTYGLVILAFTDAIMGIDSLTLLNRPVEAAGFCVAVIIFLFLSTQRFDKPILPFVYRVMLPAMVLLMFGARMLSDEKALAPEAFDVLFFALYGAVTMLALSHLVAILRAGELSPVLTVAFVYASYGLAALAGMALWELVKMWGGDARVVMLITWIVYFAYLALSPAVQHWRRLVKDQQSDQAPLPQSPSIDWRLFGEQHGLSQRESEIMEYLGRGHSSTFISQTLVISDNTVRTHTRHIYRKVGVNSRDELLKVVGDFQRSHGSNGE